MIKNSIPVFNKYNSTKSSLESKACFLVSLKILWCSKAQKKNNFYCMTNSFHSFFQVMHWYRHETDTKNSQWIFHQRRYTVADIDRRLKNVYEMTIDESNVWKSLNKVISMLMTNSIMEGRCRWTKECSKDIFQSGFDKWCQKWCKSNIKKV